MKIENIHHKRKELRQRTPLISAHGASISSLKHPNKESIDLLKNNSRELSFKGSFSRQTVYQAGELLKLVDKKFREHVSTSINNIIDKTGGRYFSKTGEKLTIQPRSPLTFFRESALYPVTQMPLDLLNFSSRVLKKCGIGFIYDSKFLSKHRENMALRQEVDSITGFFNSVSKLLPEGKNVDELTPKERSMIQDFLSKNTQKIFDSNTGHYDVAKERSLNRIVSGTIPAFFLANDAYNLSRLINNKPEDANEESKIRFRQELIRVFATAYLQLMMFGGFSKLVNNSKWASPALSVGIVLSTETFSRLLNGKPITFISKKKAQKLHEKEKNKNSKQNSVLKSKEENAVKKDEATDKIVPKPLMNQIKQKNENKNEFFSFKTLERWAIGSIGIGLAATYARKFSAVEKAYKGFTGVFKNFYTKITTQDATISKTDFNNLMKRLREEGLESQAEFYEKQYKKSIKQDNEIIKLGKQDKWTKQIVNLIVGPFKFLWGTLALPFNLFKLAFSLIDPKTKSFFLKSAKTPKDFHPVAILNEKMKKMDKDSFKEYLHNNLLASFNDISKSGVSNADLAKLVKIFSSTTTSWFLIADNYNMVMIKSNGENKEDAVQKGKERFVQRVSSIFYQTLLIDLFNNTFKKFYHSSLAGMSLITGTCTLCQEVLTRSAIGMPILPHSKEEIEKIENDHNNQKGMLGHYYRFMSKLTGKKQISERNKTNEQK